MNLLPSSEVDPAENGNSLWLVFGFKVGLVSQWAVADRLGLIPKDGPETSHHNFDLQRREWFPLFGKFRIKARAALYV